MHSLKPPRWKCSNIWISLRYYIYLSKTGLKSELQWEKISYQANRLLLTVLSDGHPGVIKLIEKSNSKFQGGITSNRIFSRKMGTSSKFVQYFSVKQYTWRIISDAVLFEMNKIERFLGDPPDLKKSETYLYLNPLFGILHPSYGKP